MKITTTAEFSIWSAFQDCGDEYFHPIDGDYIAEQLELYLKEAHSIYDYEFFYEHCRITIGDVRKDWERLPVGVTRNDLPESLVNAIDAFDRQTITVK